MPKSRDIWSWIWPPAIARRLWLVIALSSAYTAGVYYLFKDVLDLLPGWADEFALVNGIVLGVLVGFRTKTAYDRWWEGRGLWGELTNHSRNLCLKARELARPDEPDRRTLAALVAGFPVALVNHLRGPTKLQDVPGFEKDTADPAHVPAYLAGRVIGLVAGWRESGRIDGHTLQVLSPHTAALMNVCGACEKINNTPLPGSYLTLLRHGLMLTFLLFPWHLLHAVGLLAVLVQGLIVYFLFGVELTAEEIERPFGFDGDDLPLETFCETIRKSAAEILGV